MMMMMMINKFITFFHESVVEFVNTSLGHCKRLALVESVVTLDNPETSRQDSYIPVSSLYSVCEIFGLI